MIAWIKEIVNFKSAKEFNFEEHIPSLGFEYFSCSQTTRIYSHDSNKVLLVVNFKDSNVAIVDDKKIFSKLNFIPNNSLLSDMFISITLKNI